MSASIFKDFDFSDFWEDDKYAFEEYIDNSPSDALIEAVEKELGHKFPKSYKELMKLHNGGVPYKNSFSTSVPTSWAQDHIRIEGFLSIGSKKSNSLCGELGHRLMIEEWDYPEIGIYICDCPSAGHDIVMLDYTNSKGTDEPKVVHVDQELNYKITVLANTFEEFIRGLKNADYFE